MKFTVERAKLAEAVNHLSRIVTGKTSLPVLDGILLSAEQGKLTIISYNLEMGIKKEIYAKCEQDGDIVINARILGDILRRLDGVSVEFSADDNLMCHIKSGSAVFDLMGMDATDFPEIPSCKTETPLILSGEILKNMVRRTIFAVASSEGTRPVLTGINIIAENGILSFIAIDGYRLAIRNEKINLNTNLNVIIPGRAIGEVVKLIEEENSDVEIYSSGNLISFETNGYTFISRLIEGVFVDYKKTVPEVYKQRIFVKAKELNDTIERISLVISDTFSTPVRCIFTTEEINLSCASSVGRATEKFPISLEGEEFEIGLNSRYLTDALKAAETEKVKIEFSGATSGVMIKPVDSDDFLYMIMPMRLK